MKLLSEKRGFRVTVLIAPSPARLYGRDFEYFPPVSPQPYFINHLRQLASQAGFEAVDLYQLLLPYADTEYLYWRDDTHWNERGHDVVARLIAGRVFGKNTP